ncbi:putative aquaporin-10 [Dirofilaria immitis]|nr:putative aquaporin-10 [Dirofilaria immitis]
MTSTEFDFYPLIVAVCFYISVFVIAELTRKFVDKYGTVDSLSFYFLMEVIATAQMCTCVYENGNNFLHYDMNLYVFFYWEKLGIITFCSGDYSTLWLVRVERLLVIIVGEIVGGYSAYRVARNLWYWSLNLSPDHAFFYENTVCKLTYKIPFMFVPSFEVIGCFLMRYILCRIPANLKNIWFLPLYQHFLHLVRKSDFLKYFTTLLFVGVPGLNPTIVSSRLQGCDGLNTIWFILTYWICPVIGWMLSAYIDHHRITISGKKTE